MDPNTSDHFTPSPNVRCVFVCFHWSETSAAIGGTLNISPSGTVVPRWIEKRAEAGEYTKLESVSTVAAILLYGAPLSFELPKR
jgi:hypothetical protein